MATPLQIEANRRNSQKSTGPCTPEGKMASRFNALKSGIHARSQVIPGEDPAELEALAAGYHQQFQPATPMEGFWVDSLIHSDWQLRRLRRVEAQLWSHEIRESEESRKTGTPLAAGFHRGLDAFTRLQRRIDATERSYYRALKELTRLTAGPRAALAEDLPHPAPDLQPAIPGADLASFFPSPPSPLVPPDFAARHSSRAGLALRL